MNHEKYKELIELSLMNELNKDENKLLNEHLLACKECASFYQEEKKFRDVLTNSNLPEPSEELLKEARFELRAALRLERNKRSWIQNITVYIKDFLSINYRTVINSTAFVFSGIVIGFLIAGYYGKGDSQTNIAEFDDLALLKSGVQINNMRIIKDPENNDQIEFAFDAVKKVKLSGSMNDEKIQKLITYSILNEKNPGVRLNSINLISDKTRMKVDNDIKIALETAAKYDENPGVRREALKTLQNYQFDETIKQTYLYILMNDDNSGLRIEAINGLIEANKQGFSFDDKVIETFKNSLAKDDNNYIQFKARTILDEVY